MTRFEVKPWGDLQFLPIGTTDGGSDVWSNGCCVQDKKLADAICRNMEAAYEQGLLDAKEEIMKSLEGCLITKF